jgi:hypothetical protein
MDFVGSGFPGSPNPDEAVYQWKGTDMLSDINQKRELREQFLRAAYDLSPGREGRLVGMFEIAEALGMDFTPEGDIGRLLETANYLGEVGLIKNHMKNYATLSITSEGIDEVEGNKRQETHPTTSFTFNAPVHGSVIGTDNTAELTNSFDFRRVEIEIEERGGEDEEALREALEEIRHLLERGENLDRGALARFSTVMERHSWFTGSVMQALLGFATQTVS